MEANQMLLTPFNFFDWKAEMVIKLRSKGLYRVTMGTEVEPNSAVEKAKYYNRLDEAYGLLCLSISRELLFHTDSLTTPNEVWVKLESLFGKTDELRGHQLENELISLSPAHFETIQEFFTKFKSLVLQLQQCGIVKKEEQLILSILSKLGPEFSVFVSTFHSAKMTLRNWQMPSLATFMECLTQEQDKLVQMGTIKSKDQALAMGVSNASKGKQKAKNSKQQEKRKFDKTKSADGGSNLSKEKDKKGKEKTKCTYCHRGWHPESSCMKKTIDSMAQLLEKNNIPVPEGARKKESTSNPDNKEKCHALVAGTSNPSSFIIDSGASRHMVSSRELFSSLHSNGGPTVRMGDDSELQTKGIGRIDMEHGYFSDVLYVPSLAANLLSVYQMTHTGEAKRVTFTPDLVEISEISSNQVVAVGYADHDERMYKFSNFIPNSSDHALVSHANETSKLWHEIFGHMNYKYLQQLHRDEMVEGLPEIRSSNGACIGCVVGKHPERSYEKGMARRATQPLGLVHSDLIGPLPTPSYGGSRYVLTFIDDYSRFCWVYFLKLKSEVFEKLKIWKALVENHSGHKIKILRTDNGKEYVNNNIQHLCEECGIQMQHSIPYTPQQNGVAERKNRSLKEMATCMIEARDLSPKLWAEAINCAAHIQNRAFHKSVKGKTPYEAWFGQKPNVSNFRIFGSRAWARIPSEKRKALEPQSRECIMVGYGEDTKGYKLFDTSTLKTFIERSVQFEEEPIPDFELAPGESSSPPHLNEISDDSSSDFSDIAEDDIAEDDIAVHESPSRPKWAEKIIEAAGELAGNPQEPRKTRSQTINASFANESELADHCYMMIGSDPTSYQEAHHDPRWRAAMQEEFQSLQENKTWDLVPLPPKRKLVQCKWIFRTKPVADGSDLKYKARLVAKGYSQIHGVDYTETFAPVAKMDSIRLALAMAASKGWEVHHMDVKSAFLHGELQEEIYMQQPEGFQEDPTLVCRLKKSLYGLKQAPRAWYAKMDAFLLSIGFCRCKSDPNVYLQHCDDNLQVIVLYVDDLLITGSCTKQIGSIKASLHSEFAMSDLGLLRQFLGLEIEQSERGILLSQSKYASDLLFKFKMAECKAAKCPFLSGIKLGEFEDSPVVDCTLYRQLVGSLLYLTHTRPDLSYAVSAVARYMQQPHEIHWKAAKRILHYVQGTKNFGVHYAAGSSLQLAGFSDSDWAGDPIDRKSTSGFVFMFSEGPIFWSSKKQHTISLSSAEAEYRAAVNAATQCVWLQGILREFGVAIDSPTNIWVDNQSAIKISTDPVQRQRTKHIEIHMHYIRGLVHDRVISLQYCPSTEQTADIFTKCFTEKTFTYLRSLLGVSDGW